MIKFIEGYQITDAPKYRMRLIHTHMDYITVEINDVDSMIKNLTASDPNYENTIQLLCTIPNVKHDSAVTVISEIGIDMFQFYTSKRLCRLSGLTPSSNEFYGKKKYKSLVKRRGKKKALSLLPV